jgi:hypothetical protein
MVPFFQAQRDACTRRICSASETTVRDDENSIGNKVFSDSFAARNLAAILALQRAA